MWNVLLTPGYTFRIFSHHYWALSLVVEGNAETVCCGERYPAPAGVLMVHPPDLPYAEYARVPGFHEWVLFQADWSPTGELMRRYPVAPVVLLGNHLSAWRETWRDIHTLWQATEASAPFRSLRLTAKMTELLAITLLAWHDAGSLSRPNAMQTRAERFVELLSFY